MKLQMLPDRIDSLQNSTSLLEFMIAEGVIVDTVAESADEYVCQHRAY